jgi:N-hydroxyarylamine O-acetyltransferase
MAPMPPDLDAYFERIHHTAGRAATLETLRALHAAHASAIAFENLSPLLGEPVGLDLASLEDKLVGRKRGGWCFEHNLLFSHVLRAIGFDVKTLAARVRWNVPEGVTPARSHMLMLVSLAGRRYVADVGFGGLTLTAPLELVPDIEQPTPHEPHRLVAAGEGYVLEAKVAGQWQALYAFDLHEQLQADYEVSNWYLAHHPQSQFVTGIIAARADADRRHALRNTRYSIHRAGGETDRRFLGSVAEMKAVLEGAFGIALPSSSDLDVRLQKVIDDHPPP